MQFYLSGQEITGQVEFSLTEAKKYKGVEIKLTGRAVVEVYELIHNQVAGTTERIEHRATETYVDKNIDLWEPRHHQIERLDQEILVFRFSLLCLKSA